MEKSNKTIKVTFRLTPEQYELLQYHARCDGKTISQLARERITLQYDNEEPFMHGK